MRIVAKQNITTFSFLSQLAKITYLRYMDVLQNIKDTLSPRLRESDMAYLYGSRARGTANEDSDWDILIVLNKDELTTEDYNEISYPLTALGWDLNQIISPMMYTKRDWEKSSFTPFYKNVQHDAIPLV